jgi:hypothetical protein
MRKNGQGRATMVKLDGYTVRGSSWPMGAKEISFPEQARKKYSLGICSLYLKSVS